MIARRACFSLLLIWTVYAPPLAAQIEGGIHGTMNSGLVSGEATLGLGGRFGGYLFATGDVNWKADAVVDYFFANCPLEGVRCWAWHAQVNIVGTRKLGQPVLGYAGLGAAYQRDRLVSSDGGSVDATGDHGGVNILVGAQFPVVGATRPFFEARYSVFEGWENQFVLSLGILFSSAKIEEEF
jgi:hypothetical protein